MKLDLPSDVKCKSYSHWRSNLRIGGGVLALLLACLLVLTWRARGLNRAIERAQRQSELIRGQVGDAADRKNRELDRGRR